MTSNSEYGKQLAAQAPPPTNQQLDRIAALLRAGARKLSRNDLVAQQDKQSRKGAA